MKIFYQIILVLLFSLFSQTTFSQVEEADDCVTQALNAFDFLDRALDPNSVEVTCLVGKGSSEMWVTWDCPPEIDQEADYHLQVAVVRKYPGVGAACFVDYGPGIGNKCNFGSDRYVFPLQGKEVSTTRSELADFCHSLP